MKTKYIIRVKSIYKRKGVLGAIRHILYKIYRNSIKKERFIFSADSRVFEKKIPTTDQIDIKLYKKFDQVPLHISRKALEIQTFELIQQDWESKFTRKQYLWVACDKGNEVVGLAWTVRKKHYNFPFFPLTDKDCVLYDVYIFNKYRNRGYGSSMIHRIVEQTLQNGIARVYIDISIWNVPSLKMIRKLEYELIGLARFSVGKKSTKITWCHNFAEKFDRLTL